MAPVCLSLPICAVGRDSSTLQGLLKCIAGVYECLDQEDTGRMSVFFILLCLRRQAPAPFSISSYLSSSLFGNHPHFT